MMQLVTGLFLWLTQKTFTILFLVLLLTLLFFATDSLRPVWERFSGVSLEKEIEQLRHRRTVIEQEIRNHQNSLPALEKKIKRLQDYHRNLSRQILENCQDLPSWLHPVDRYMKKKECEGWETLQEQQAELEAAQQAYQKTTGKVRHLEKEKLEIANAVAALTDAHPLRRLYRTFRENMFHISWIILLVFGGPPVWKTIRYFVLARWAEKAEPIQFEHHGGMMQTGTAVKNIPVTIEKDEPLLVREGYLSTRENVQTRTRLCWKWKAPFISYAAGLVELTEFSVREPSEKGTASFSSGHAGTYIAEIRLDDHSGIMLHPKHIVAVSGDIRLRTRWVFTSLHSWLSGQHRFIIFHGTGRIFIEGQEGIEPVRPNSSGTRVEEPLLMGYETRLRYAISRTETFWPYFRNRTRLFDLELEGDGIFLRQVAPDAGGRPKTVAGMIFSAFTGSVQVVGKFFGF